MKSKSRHHPISFIGKYEITVLGDQRLILPSKVIQQLRHHDIDELLIGKLPGSNALIMCPEALWGRWLDKLNSRFPSLQAYAGARSFLIPWQPIHWDAKGRISLPRRAREHIGITAHDDAILVGTGFYFELWGEDQFNQITQECEFALRETIESPLSDRSSISLGP